MGVSEGSTKRVSKRKESEVKKLIVDEKNDEVIVGSEATEKIKRV